MKKSMFAVHALLAAVWFAGSAAASPLQDISSHWAKANIEAAVAVGYVNGYPDGSFRPEGNVTRAEFIKMLVDALDLPTAEGGEWFEPYVRAAVNAGIHTEADFVNYNAELNRLQLMRLVSRALATEPTYEAYLDAFSGLYNGDLPYVDYRELTEADVPYAALAIGSGVLGGYPDASMGLSKNATRAEAVVMIERLLALRGSDPQEKLALRELKEVAETGTNAQSVSNLIPQINLQTETATVVTDNYTIELKRYYVIPIEGTVRSIYERKFLWDRNELPEHYLKVEGLRGFVVNVTDLTPNRDANQEIFAANTYLSPSWAFFHGTPSKQFEFFQPYPTDYPVILKKDTPSEVMFYGWYTNQYFDVRIQSNKSHSGGHILLFNPEKPVE